MGSILGVPNLGIVNQLDRNTNKFTQEFRLTSETPAGSEAGGVEWITGLYYTHEKSRSSEYLNPVRPTDGAPITTLPLIVDQLQRLTYKEVAWYGDATYHVTSQFNVQAGVRYSRNEQDSVQSQSDSVFGSASSIPSSGKDTVWTYLISPQYKFSDDVMAYGRIATGYRAGGPNFILGNPNAQAFGPDKTTNYEVGFKGAFLDRSVYLEANAFYIDWKDIQLQARDANNITFYANAGSARSQGFEVSCQFRPSQALTL
jgi:iron complex outermembrane recepter protein